MAIITGTTGSDQLQGTDENDTVNAGLGNDIASGEGGDDLINGGGGDDTLYGDAGENVVPGEDTGPLTLDIDNYVSGSDTSSGSNNADAGDSAIYTNVATLADGTAVSGRLVLVSKSDDDLNVDISGGDGFEILLNSGRGSGSSYGGETATFRLEFFIPDPSDPTTGTPVSLNSTATFNDLDRNSVGDQESVTIDGGSFTQFGVADDTTLDVTNTGGVVNASGTETNSPDDQDAWFSAAFENREFIEFTLETRTTQSGFSMNGDLIDDAVVTPIIPGNDTINGGSGNDTIFGQQGNDTIDGGADDDTIDGGSGEDVILGGSGNDNIEGGSGEDTITGGTGVDEIYGGLNSDLILGGNGGDVVVGGEDADGNDVDVLDLTGSNVDFITYTSADQEEGIVTFDDGSTMEFSEIESVVPCFTPGTRIATPKGERAIEELVEGDRIFTRDNGIQEIRWIGSRAVGRAEMAKNPNFQPVLVQAGSLGNGMPERDLLLSPNHRVLITGSQASLFFGETEVLTAAKHLTGMDGVSQVQAPDVTYVHMMFDRHEVVLSDGAWSESFQAGDYSLKGVGQAQRREILALFPDLELQGTEGFEAARKVLKKHEARLLS